MAIVACVLFLVGLVLDVFWLRLLGKPMIHLALISWMLDQSRSRYRDYLVVGVSLCMVGDFLLEFRDTLFLPGVLVFLLGHVALIGAFLNLEKRLFIERAIPFALWGTVLFVILAPGLGAMTVPVLLYTIAICMMMWRAGACLGEHPTNQPQLWIVVIGAVSFAFGDTLIALDRFHSPLSNARYVIIISYWFALMCISQSASLPKRSPSSGI